jgi:hypothetical protein
MAGVLDVLRAYLGGWAPSGPPAEPPPGFWYGPPPAGIPAQEPWRLGGDNVVPPGGRDFNFSATDPNDAGIYGRVPRARGNQDTVVPAAPQFQPPGLPGANVDASMRSLHDLLRRFNQGALPVDLDRAIQGRDYNDRAASALRTSSPLNQMMPRGGWM